MTEKEREVRAEGRDPVNPQSRDDGHVPYLLGPPAGTKQVSIAAALGAKTFETAYRVRCLGRPGPHNGAKLTFTFEVEP